MKILVTFALENEFAPWRERREFRSETRGKTDAAKGDLKGAETYTTIIDGARVDVTLTGAGPKPAASAISQAIQATPEGIDYYISAGLAGALRNDYRVGQVLAARAVKSGAIQEGGEGDTLPSSEALLLFATECGATPVEMFHTAGRVIGRAVEKKHLGESADAVEMESYVILREARRRGIPAIAIRSISDSADEDLPFDMTGIFTEDGRVSMPLVLAQMARHPQSISSVMKLGQAAKTAATELAAFLDRYIVKLATGGAGREVKFASARNS